MLYQLMHWQKQATSPLRIGAELTHQLLTHPGNPLAYTNAGRAAAAFAEMFERFTRHFAKPAFGFSHAQVDGKTVAVHEEILERRPFCQLRHFKRDTKRQDPKVLLVAPMSGHFATLLRGTVERMLPTTDVYITDWRDAKLVPLSDGSFDLDDYVDYVIEFLETIGKAGDGSRPHMLAVCQPSVPCYAAAALMSADKNPHRPATLTLMGGPIDTREAPTAVNTMATERPHVWFEQNVIATIPATYPGAGRRVYPGFLQLAGFMSMNLGSHMMSHYEMFKHLVQGDDDSADATKDFYDEYRSVCDMTAEFYLQTIDVVFQDHALPRGTMEHRGRRVDAGAITDVALLAIEGERDDISGLGQTKAALTLATNLPESEKHYVMAKGAGHYGIFNGSKWRKTIAPVVEQWIATHA